MDVFIDKKKKVWIVDFNPFGDPSSALLFEWHELLALLPNNIKDEKELDIINRKNNESSSLEVVDIKCIDFEFRIIRNQSETFSNALGSSRGPIDVTLAPDFHKFMEICKNQDKEEKNAEL
jgi:D123